MILRVFAKLNDSYESMKWLDRHTCSSCARFKKCRERKKENKVKSRKIRDSVSLAEVRQPFLIAPQMTGKQASWQMKMTTSSRGDPK